MLETILIGIIWVITGVFISFKRNWYTHISYNTKSDRNFLCTMNIIFAPIALVIAMYKEFLFDKWNNEEDSI